MVPVIIALIGGTALVVTAAIVGSKGRSDADRHEHETAVLNEAVSNAIASGDPKKMRQVAAWIDSEDWLDAQQANYAATVLIARAQQTEAGR
jgi:hypothetical protein